MQGRAIFCLLIAAAALAAQSPAPRARTPAELPITSITLTGNKTLPTDAVLAAAGLKVHDPGGAAAFDAARDRLLNTFYFDQVSYSFHQQDGGFAVTFSVAEMKQVYPLHVEALPITTEEVSKLLKSKDPLFNGLLPGAQQSIDRAAATVEQSLAATNPSVRVRAKVVSTGPDRYEILLAPAEGLPVIADVTFDGSKLISANELHSVIVENGIGQPFSDAGVQEVLDRFIRPLFEKQGYMRVRFSKIASAPDPKVKGMDVHVTIDDGPQYRLGTLSVRGAMAGSASRIIRIANIPRGEFVNGDEIRQAVTRIHDTLRGEGYLDVSVSTGRSINDATKTVDAWFDVVPGDVYTFGHLEILNLGLDGEAAIRKMWSVKTGDPFPGGYPDRFIDGVKQESMFDNLGVITATPSINHQTHVVDVSLHFGSAPLTPRRTEP